MNSSPDISIIIPVYNVEKYLRECLNSIVNQTFKNIEVICINDGSTDRSLEILREYEQKDDRFVVISQENKGVSAARNTGIDRAKGEYIMFVDSDDWIANNACERVYNTAKAKNCDILLFSHYKFTNYSYTSDGRLLDLYIASQGQCITFEQFSEFIILSPCESWGKLYRTDFIKQNKLQFPMQIQFGEDRVFYLEACIKAKSICVLFEHLYYYRFDSNGSLVHNSKTSLPHLYKMHIAIKHIIDFANIERKDIVYSQCLNRTIRAYLWQWYSIHNSSVQSKGIKYLCKIAKECKKFSKRNRKYLTDYDRLMQTIFDYRKLYLKKLFEPLFEIEFRRNRIAVYLFEKQIANFSTGILSKLLLNMRYFKHLCRLRLWAKHRKIKIGLWLTEIQKWSSHASLYKALLENPHFEPFVLLANFKKPAIGISPQEHMAKGIEFFESKGIRYKLAYDVKRTKHLNLKDFKPDIIFYQQPWQISEEQSLINTSKHSLICYIPYCYYSLNSYVNYMHGFHGMLWKYFVETDLHKGEYEKNYNAKNCTAVGSCKLDNYKLLDTSKINQIWKTTGKKRIIYAPHHCFELGLFDYRTATFDKNGDFILKLAKSHPEFEWIFRPHPAFKDRIINYKIKTVQEIDNYYTEWEKIGSIYTGGDYYEMFAGSDCLITDCISFLSEYLPTGKPVIHLRKDNQKINFNAILTKITDSYYKVYDNETLEKVFNEVVVGENDYLKEERTKNIKLLMIDENKTAGEKIADYLEKELWIRK